MTENGTTGAPPPEGPAPSPGQPAPSRGQDEQEAGTFQAAEDPGYLTRTGEVVSEDGSVVPIIGGLPAVEGSAWDTGAPLDDRGEDLADDHDSAPDADGNQLP